MRTPDNVTVEVGVSWWERLDAPSGPPQVRILTHSADESTMVDLSAATAATLAEALRLSGDPSWMASALADAAALLGHVQEPEHDTGPFHEPVFTDDGLNEKGGTS